MTHWPWHWGEAAASLLNAPVVPGGQAELLAVTAERLANQASLCPAAGQHRGLGK